MSILILRSSIAEAPPFEGQVIFNPGNLGAYTTPQQVFPEDVNRYGEGGAETFATVALQSTVTRPGGSSKAIQITYPQNEAGAELYFSPGFTATQGLYQRWYMMLDANWQGNWPAGLKTPRSFTAGTTYHSSKMIWSKYLDGSGFAPDGPGVPNNDYVWGCCSAAYNLDVGAAYSPAMNFDNGLPYVRAGVWYLYEIYQEMNSADNVADGKLEMRIDRRVVFQDNTFAWEASARGATGGLAGWINVWFGGNFSAGDRGFTSGVPLHRYEDEYFVSTDPRWVS